jgi:hypothetical protein
MVVIEVITKAMLEHSYVLAKALREPLHLEEGE